MMRRYPFRNFGCWASLMALSVFGAVAGANAQAVAPQIVLPSDLLQKTTPRLEVEASSGASRAPALAIMDRSQSLARQAGANGGPQAGQSQVPTRLLTLSPLGPRLPDQVQMGASFSEPGVLRLTGEIAQIDLGVLLPENIDLPDHLVISRRSSVNVNDEISQLEVQINDAPVQTIALDALSGFEPINISSQGLRTGQNVISLRATQPHRIFCGPDASFGTWSEIDLRQSGLALPAGTLTVDAKGFATAFFAQVSAGIGTNLLIDENMDPDVIRNISDQLAVALGGEVPFALRSFYSIRTPSEASIAIIASDSEGVSYRRGARGGLVLNIQVKDGNVPDLTAVLEDLHQYASLSEPPEERSLALGQVVPLSDIGMRDSIANTHYYSQNVKFVLPSDWLLLANQRAELDLHYGFAKELPAGATLLVKANGHTIRLLPLDQNGGKIQPILKIPFAASYLHSGLNNLSFEMMVPGNPHDEACTMRSEDMLVLLSDSTLYVPPSPQMALPGLAQSLIGLAPAAVHAVDTPQASSGTQTLAVGEKSPKHIALEIASRLDQPERVNPAASLTLVGLNGVAAMPLDNVGLQARDIQNLLLTQQRAVAVRSSNDDLAPEPTKIELNSPRFTLGEPGTSKPDITDPAAQRGWLDRLIPNLGLADWVNETVDNFVKSAFLGSSQTLQDWLGERKAVAILLRPDPNQPDALWMVVGHNPNIGQLSRALNQLSISHLGRGEAAILSANSDQWEVWQPVRPLILKEGISLSNMRTILGNYASWSPIFFTAFVMAMAVLSAIPALIYVVLSRRRGGGA